MIFLGIRTYKNRPTMPLAATESIVHRLMAAIPLRFERGMVDDQHRADETKEDVELEP